LFPPPLEGFYARLGFVPVREDYHDDERTIIMAKDIAIPTQNGGGG
jgi:predicted GNAT family N-acyltransferase